MSTARFLQQASAGKDVSTEGGASGYFSAPSEGLDPNLFDGMSSNPVEKPKLFDGRLSNPAEPPKPFGGGLSNPIENIKSFGGRFSNPVEI